MPKQSKALLQMPPTTIAALQRLGWNLAVARLRRNESLVSWASRIGVSVPTTLLRLESGDPGVGMGIYATALWVIGLDGTLAELGAPKLDQGALELEVSKAVELGKSRSPITKVSEIWREEAPLAEGTDESIGA